MQPNFLRNLKQTHPHWKEKMAQGDLAILKNWLHENIHQYGRQYTNDEICTRITGKTVNEEAYLNYLKNKYKALYHIENF